MTKYRNKSVVIEAVQYTGLNKREIFDFTGGIVNISIEENTIKIRTLEGLMDVSKDDWVIKGVQGEFYPIKPDIFDETYELVESDQKHVCGPYIDVDVVAHRCTKCGKTSIYEVNISTDKLKFIGTLEALE